MMLKRYKAQLLFLMRYGISGAAGGITQTAVLYIWVTVLGLVSTYLVGLSLGFLAALITSFLLQKYWAFRDVDSKRSSVQALSYTTVALMGLVLNALLLAGAKEIFEFLSIDFFAGWYVLVQLVIVGIVSVFNFSMNFLITFRHARRDRLWARPSLRARKQSPLENRREDFGEENRSNHAPDSEAP